MPEDATPDILILMVLIKFSIPHFNLSMANLGMLVSRSPRLFINTFVKVLQVADP